MKITIKTLQQKQFQIDAEGSDTVADLKAKVAATQGHAVESQKLIYAGKVLSDDKTVESCEIKEKDFLVLMVSRPKPPVIGSSSGAAVASPAASSSTPQTATPAPIPTPSPTPATPAAALATPAPAVPASSSLPAVPAAGEPRLGDSSTFLTGEALQTTIQNMIEMGFERAQVMRALKASFNNPDRAVEYLMTGIPAHLEQEAASSSPPPATSQPDAPPASAVAPPPASAPVQAAPPATPAAPAQSGPQNLFQLAQQQQQGASGNIPIQREGSNPLAALGVNPEMGIEALRSHPQIGELRNLMAQNPALLQSMIQQLAQSDPAMAQYLAQNPNVLLQLLGTLDSGGEGEEGDPEGALPPGAQTISVTPEERAAIDRLQALGFPQHLVIEAYFACDKNEEMAANYLFENGFDDQ